MEEIIKYDRMGFIPSKHTESLEEYKQESREKLSFLLKIQDDSEKVLYEKFGQKLKLELYEPPRWLKENFKKITLTDTWPGIILDDSEFAKIKTKTYKDVFLRFSPLFPLLILTLFGGGGKLDFEEKVDIPIITYEESLYSHEEKYTHELVHVIRSQFKTAPDELHAYKIQDKINNTTKFSPLHDGFFYGLEYALVFGYNTPLILTSYFLFLPLLFTPLCIVPITTYNFHKRDKKFDKFVTKCENEKLNPFYLLLRSDFKEYKSNKPIKEQLKEKKGLRWDIIRLRMEKDF